MRVTTCFVTGHARSSSRWPSEFDMDTPFHERPTHTAASRRIDHLHVRLAVGEPSWSQLRIVHASGSSTADAVTASQTVPRFFACAWSSAPGQRGREEALPPACRRRPRLPANPYTRRPAYAIGVPKPFQRRSGLPGAAKTERSHQLDARTENAGESQGGSQARPSTAQRVPRTPWTLSRRTAVGIASSGLPTVLLGVSGAATGRTRAVRQTPARAVAEWARSR